MERSFCAEAIVVTGVRGLGHFVDALLRSPFGLLFEAWCSIAAVVAVTSPIWLAGIMLYSMVVLAGYIPPLGRDLWSLPTVPNPLVHGRDTCNSVLREHIATIVANAIIVLVIDFFFVAFVSGVAWCVTYCDERYESQRRRRQ